MKRESGLVYRFCLMVGDVLAIVSSLTFAYYFRVNFVSKPIAFDASTYNYLLWTVILVPIWLLILAALGLYQKNIFLGKSRLPELGRLALASIIGTMAIVTVDFLSSSNNVPARSIVAYSVFCCFLFLIIERTVLRLIRRLVIIRSGRGMQNIVIVGNNENTKHLAEYISTSPESGYNIVGIIANDKYIPKRLTDKKYSSLKKALDAFCPDVIFQTDEHQCEYFYKQAINKHILYYFVPTSSTLSSHIGELELIGSTPSIRLNVTPLIGGARFIKRFFDILLSILGIIVAILPMGIIWIIVKLSDPKAPAIYSEQRLSRFDKYFKIYKFRSMKPAFSGMSPEAAFEKMGKPELIKQYRDNGDYLEDDPRITPIGRFLRKTSLDELPQLFNVLKGDISLIGPRALVPGELRNYGDRSLLLSVKSGVTGLAQVSGRRDISFDERRALDIYYIQNWSLLLDVQILIKTFGAVLKRKGAK